MSEFDYLNGMNEDDAQVFVQSPKGSGISRVARLKVQIISTKSDGTACSPYLRVEGMCTEPGPGLQGCALNYSVFLVPKTTDKDGNPLSEDKIEQRKRQTLGRLKQLAEACGVAFPKKFNMDAFVKALEKAQYAYLAYVPGKPRKYMGKVYDGYPDVQPATKEAWEAAYETTLASAAAAVASRAAAPAAAGGGRSASPSNESAEDDLDI